MYIPAYVLSQAWLNKTFETSKYPIGGITDHLDSYSAELLHKESYNCRAVSEATLNDKGKWISWIR